MERAVDLERALGKTDVTVSPVVLGCSFMRASSDAERVDVIAASVDAGVRSLDTAPLYEFGAAETRLGRAIRGRREQVVLLTKVGLRWDDGYGDVMFHGDVNGVRCAVRKDARPVSVRRDVESSLRRLGVEYLDVVQVHQYDRHTPVSDTMGELVRLRDEGKLRAIGVSNFPPAAIEEAAAALDPVPLASHQLELNLLCRDALGRDLPLARRLEVSGLVYSPLARGLLAGRTPTGRGWDAGDMRRFDPGYVGSRVDAVARIIRDVVDPLAGRHGVGPAQIALAWVLHQPGVTAVVAGASRIRQAQDNAAAARVRLSEGEVAELGRTFAQVPAPPQRSTTDRVRRWVRRPLELVRRWRSDP